MLILSKKIYTFESLQISLRKDVLIYSLTEDYENNHVIYLFMVAIRSLNSPKTLNNEKYLTIVLICILKILEILEYYH